MGNPKRGRGGSRGEGGELGEKSATRGLGGRSTTGRAPPWQAGGTGSSIQQGSINPVQAVFGQSELLELILDYSVHDQDREKRLKTLASVRLVNKSWLTRVSSVTRKNKELLYNLTLTKDNSLSGTPFVEAQGKLLDQLVTSVGNRIQQPFPTFSLKIMMEFFRRENYQSLVTCLRQCGQGLVKLEMIIPVNAGSLPGILPAVKLPLLQKLVVTFSPTEVHANLTGRELKFGHSTNVVSLIQGLLTSAPSLKEFTIPLIGPNNTAYPAPAGIEILTFPESITTLYLRCLLTSEDMEMLITNRLPNLQSLYLQLDNAVYADGSISKILTNFSETLRVLCLIGMVYRGPPRRSHLARFPLMTELTQLVTYSKMFELENRHALLSQCLPKLRGLSLQQQTPDMFQKWTSTGPLNLVKEFALRLIDENQPATSSLYTLPINLDSMQKVHLTFPNIQILTLELSSGETESSGLKYLFLEMRQLTYLKIKVAGSELVANSNYWDSVLTGVPVSMIACLRENRDYWKLVELNEEVPSIGMLTELQSLTLEAVVSGGNLQPLISDLSFTLALLNLPKLVNLRMYGRFLTK